MTHYRPADRLETGTVAVVHVEGAVPLAGAQRRPRTPSDPLAAAVLVYRLVNGQHRFALDLVRRPATAGEMASSVDRLLPPAASLVTWDGGATAIPTLMLGALAERRFDMPALRAMQQAKRYQPPHVDLADRLLGPGQEMPLTAMCVRLCLTPPSPVDRDLEGRLDEPAIDAAARRAAESVATTFQIWLHHAAWQLRDEEVAAEPLVAMADWLARTRPAGFDLAAFGTGPAFDWARDSLARLADDPERLREERELQGILSRPAPSGRFGPATGRDREDER